MKQTTTKLAAVLALIIGAMAIVAGGKVLLGQDPGYYVIDWLPVYNFTAGLITASVTAVLLWKSHRYGRIAALLTFGAHALVMATLMAAYRDVVAPDSLRAMTVRLVVWTLILGLLFAGERRERAQQTTAS